MSGRPHRHHAIRNAAIVALAAGVVLGGVAAVAGPAAAQQDEPTKSGGSIFKRIWTGIAGGTDDKTDDGKDQAPPAAAQPEPREAPAPSLAAAEWIGFTPVLAVGAAAGDGAWIAGPVPQAGTQGWVTDTVSGLTTPVLLVWREAEPGSLAQLSAEAAEALGLSPGAVVHVAIYVGR
jgi:hypothetical protein